MADDVKLKAKKTLDALNKIKDESIVRTNPQPRIPLTPLTPKIIAPVILQAPIVLTPVQPILRSFSLPAIDAIAAGLRQPQPATGTSPAPAPASAAKVQRLFPKRQIGDVKPPAKIKPDPSVGGKYAAHQFLNLSEVAENIKTDPNARVAIAISGGGARGAYEAGVVEAILQEFKTMGLAAPSVVTGTSAGSICATCLFTETVFNPMLAPDPAAPIFTSWQSKVWRDGLAKGNNAAVRLFGNDKGLLIQYLSHEKTTLGYIEEFLDGIGHLKEKWQTAKGDIEGLSAAWSNFKSSLGNLDASAMARDFNTMVNKLHNDGINLDHAVGDLKKACAAVDWDFWNWGDEAKAIGAGIKEFCDAIPPFEQDVVAGIENMAGDGAKAFLDYIEKIGPALSTLGQAMAKLAKDAGAVLLALLEEIGVVLLALVAAVTVIVALLLPLLVGLGLFAFGAANVPEALLPSDKIEGILRDYMSAVSNANGGNGMPVIDKWKSLPGSGSKAELLLSSTDLTAGRQMVFALADKDRVAKIALDDVWVTDLASQLMLDPFTTEEFAKIDTLNPNASNYKMTLGADGKPEKLWSSKYFALHSKEVGGNELLVKATMTSSTIPGVFPPKRWNLSRRNPSLLTAPGMRAGATWTSGMPQNFLPHVFIDGGLIDNSPIDLAVYGGANHIISLELTPLLSYDINQTDKEWTADTGSYNIPKTYAKSFFAAMDGSLLRSLDYISNSNKSAPPQNKVKVYRMAPLLPNQALAADPKSTSMPPALKTYEFSPGIVSFDGIYNENSHALLMNLYDWFMQGYIDAKGMSEADLVDETGNLKSHPEDGVLNDYLVNAAQYGSVRDPVATGNMFWITTEQPLPELMDYQNAKIDIPNLNEIVKKARYL